MLSLMGAQDAGGAAPGHGHGSSSGHGYGGSEKREFRLESTEEPATKKLRTSFQASSSSSPATASSQARRDALREKVRTTLLPHIIRAIQPLSHEFDRDGIAVETASIMAKDMLIRSALTPTGDTLLAQRAVDLVRQLCLSPKYQRGKKSPVDVPVVIKEEQLTLPVMDAVPQAMVTPTTSKMSKGSIATAVTRAPAVPTTIVRHVLPALTVAAPALLPNRLNRALCKSYKPRIKRETSSRATPQWTRLRARPYLSSSDREAIRKGSRLAFAKTKSLRNGPAIYHVDFSAAEIAKIVDELKPFFPGAIPRTSAALQQLCVEYPIPSYLNGKLPGRAEHDIRNFCSDLLAEKAADAGSAKILSLYKQTPQRVEHQREVTVSSLLFARELEGHAGMGRTRRYVNFQSTFKQTREDAMSLAAEFTNCAGDISTMTWVPHQNILCGTTAHSDAHNQQYNKPGNLLLCSISKGVLRAFPDHRIPRPLVAKGENSSLAMRRSQDPWIYSSVVSSDYDKIHGLAYTSSFDKTIKAWKVDEDGGSMEARATFKQNGNVNFVAVANDGSGRVAVASDTTTEAVRIYTMDPDNIAESPYYTISCPRSDADDSDKWAYCPATVQWGRARGTRHLLVVGYSPRSFSGDEQDIPEDKLQTGGIMLWDAQERRQVPVMTATTANVFEVAWHPTVCGFVVGTSPVGLHVDHGVRTQLHVFGQDWAQHPDGAYAELQKLDCFASDINELTIMPNSMQSSYITAACTDGKVYVWDMAQGDKPIHVLEHGSPLEEVRPEDREREDTGVKFTAWGSDLTRLYTGASDGVVKVWNIRNRHKPFVRDLLCAPGPISCGSFSPDYSKLAIGDATGRLFLFSVTKDEKLEEQFTMVLPGTDRCIQRPKPFTPHPEPPPPPPAHADPDAMQLDDPQDAESDVDAATLARRAYLDTQQLTIHSNPVIGAVQGPQYAASGLFLRDAHLDDDPAAPLVTGYERLQLESRHSVLGGAGSSSARRRRSLRRLVPAPATPDEASERRHRDNVAQEFDAAALEDADMQALVRAGALLDLGDEGEDWGFTYEDGPTTEDDSDAYDTETES